MSPGACQGDCYQIALEMEMPIKLTARQRLSFRFTLQVDAGVYRSDLLNCTGKGGGRGGEDDIHRSRISSVRVAGIPQMWVRLIHQSLISVVFREFYLPRLISGATAGL